MTVRIPVLALGGVLALAVSLSAHAVLLDRFHLPSPHLPRGAWVRFPDHLMQVAAVFATYRLFSPTLRASPGKAWLVLLLAMLTVTETLFRDPFMEVVNNSNLTLYPFLDVAPAYLTAAVVALGAVATRRYATTLPGAATACVVVALAAYVVVSPLANAAFVPVRAWTALREGHSLYDPPYDWHILVPAYATFAEPVLGSFLVCALTSRRLPAAPWKAALALGLIVFAMRGVLFGCFLYAMLTPADPVVAFLSEAQFAIENALLALIVAATWTAAMRRTAD